MADTQRISIVPGFEENHPAVEALNDKIENLKAEYERLAGVLSDYENNLEHVEAEYQLIQSRVRVARANLYSNERQQAALLDAIEYLAGKRS